MREGMNELVEIDGSEGEGGGQIVRTALSLAMVTRRSFRIEKLRARRSRPGLLRQHLTAVTALAKLCAAEVQGAELGSRALEFRPSLTEHGSHEFAVGTAGSATLVLQTAIVGLLGTPGTSRIRVDGGTENPKAPPSDFLVQAWAPLVRRLGVDLRIEVERRGYYPAGGGRIVATVSVPERLQSFDLFDRGALLQRRAVARVSALPVGIAQRELGILKSSLELAADELGVEEERAPRGPGNLVSVAYRAEHSVVVFTAFGEKGRPAERVAGQLAAEAARWWKSGAAIDEHLADQLVLLLALAGGGAFTTTAPSLHTRTQIELIPRFVPVAITVESAEDVATISISGTRG